jgi:hypothetical protein
MGPIYSQCKNAALWLGREFEEADAVAEAAFLRDPLDPNLAFSGSKDSVSPILHRIRIDPRMGKKLQYFRRTESVEDELNERKLFNLDASQELRMALPARISSLFERRDADPVASVIHDVKTIVETHGCCVTNDSWLRDGQLDNNTLFMLCFIYALASDEHPGAMGFLRDFCYRRNALRILNRLVHCQRWTRIWVVQETVLAPNATLMFGSFSIPWSTPGRRLNCHTT